LLLSTRDVFINQSTVYNEALSTIRVNTLREFALKLSIGELISFYKLWVTMNT